MAYIIVAHIVAAYVFMAFMVMADIVMAYIVMAYIGMADIFMAYIGMVYIVMAHIVMVGRPLARKQRGAARCTLPRPTRRRRSRVCLRHARERRHVLRKALGRFVRVPAAMNT